MTHSLDSEFGIGGLHLKKADTNDLVTIIQAGGELVLTDKLLVTYLYKVKGVNRNNKDFPLMLERVKRLSGNQWVDAEGEIEVSTRFLTERPVYKIVET